MQSQHKASGGFLNYLKSFDIYTKVNYETTNFIFWIWICRELIYQIEDDYKVQTSGGATCKCNLRFDPHRKIAKKP